MPAWLDQVLVLAAVLMAVGYFVRRWLRNRRNGAGCGGGCGCAARNPAPKAWKQPFSG